MKSKLLITMALCAIALGVNAQTEKGKNFINGSFGYKSTQSGYGSSNGGSMSNYGDTSRSFNAMPRFGHFFSKNLAIGIGIGYNRGKLISSNSTMSTSSIIFSTQTSKQNSFNFGPFVRYYVDVADKFKFFGQLNMQIGFGKTTTKGTQTYYNLISSTTTPFYYSTFDNNYKFTNYSASLSPGFAFFPSKRWAIEFSFPLLDYNKTKPKDKEPAGLSVQTIENFNFATDSFNPSIGFNFHF